MQQKPYKTKVFRVTQDQKPKELLHLKNYHVRLLNLCTTTFRKKLTFIPLSVLIIQ